VRSSASLLFVLASVPARARAAEPTTIEIGVKANGIW